MVKLEHCWPWLARRGLQSTAKCNSAAPKRRPLPESLTEMQPTKWGLMAKPGHDEKGRHFQDPKTLAAFSVRLSGVPFILAEHDRRHRDDSFQASIEFRFRRRRFRLHRVAVFGEASPYGCVANPCGTRSKPSSRSSAP